MEPLSYDTPSYVMGCHMREAYPTLYYPSLCYVYGSTLWAVLLWVLVGISEHINFSSLISLFFRLQNNEIVEGESIFRFFLLWALSLIKHSLLYQHLLFCVSSLSYMASHLMSLSILCQAGVTYERGSIVPNCKTMAWRIVIQLGWLSWLFWITKYSPVWIINIVIN